MFNIKCAGIYKIENKITGYYYIGMSINIFNRFSSHYTQLKSNKHSEKFKQDLDQYGIESFNFEILEYISISKYKIESGLKGTKLENSFRTHLLKIERGWMKKYSINFCYNKDNKYFS